MNWQARARAAFLGFISFLTMALGGIDWPFARRRTRHADVLRALAVLEQGDVMLFARRGAPTNLLIPGPLTHTAIFVGNDELVEAIGTGSQVSDIYDVIGAHDRFVIVRSLESTPEECAAAATVARTLVGRGYDPKLQMAEDYGEKIGNARLYCGELPVVAFRTVNPRFRFHGRRRMGVWTAEPMDYVTSPDQFRIVLDSAAQVTLPIMALVPAVRAAG